MNSWLGIYLPADLEFQACKAHPSLAFLFAINGMELWGKEGEKKSQACPFVLIFHPEGKSFWEASKNEGSKPTTKKERVSGYFSLKSRQRAPSVS